jgi:chromosomal replication initiation ATPase DnaA
MMNIDMSAVDEAHKRLRSCDSRLNWNLLLDVVSHTFQVKRSKLVGPSREVPLPRARQGLVWVARTLTDWSQHSLGERLARDHSSIAHAERTAERLRSSDPDFRALTDAMMAVLEPYCAARCGMEADHAG